MKDEKMLQADMRNALASLEIEGFYLSPEQKALCDEVIFGRLSMDEFIEIMLRKLAMRNEEL